MNVLCEQINHIRTTVHAHPQLSLKFRLPNGISFDVFDWCFCKVEVKRYAKRLWGLGFI